MKPFILFFARMRFFVVLWSSAFFLATSCTTAEKSVNNDAQNWLTKWQNVIVIMVIHQEPWDPIAQQNDSI